MSEYPHVPAAFINAIREEGTKAEACDYLQNQWNETCALRAENERLREALEWYKAQVGGCNRYGSDGDKCRDALAKDIGERARAALQADGGRE